MASALALRCQNTAPTSSGVLWRSTPFRLLQNLQYIAVGTPLRLTDALRSAIQVPPKPSSDVTCWILCFW